MLASIALAVAGAVCWRRRSLSRLRRELAAPRRPDVAALLDAHGRAGHPVTHRRLRGSRRVRDESGLSMAAVIAGRWAEPGAFVRCLRGVAAGLRTRGQRWRWPVMQMAAALLIVAPALVVPDVVRGEPGSSSVARAVGDSDGVRGDYVGFARRVLDSSGEDEGGRSGVSADTGASAGEGTRAGEGERGDADQAGGSGDSRPAGKGRVKPDRAKPPPVTVSPYLFLAGSKIPNARAVMRRTGVNAFTLAFILSDGGCRPVWTGGRSLRHPVANRVRAIQAAGGEVSVSFGGWSGHKLGRHCPHARALARAYQRVIDAYQLRAIDIDIEHLEFSDPHAQDRVLRATKIVKAHNPDLTIGVTMPVTRNGLDRWGQRLVRRAAQLGAPVDAWTIMPFVLGQPGGDMGRLTIRAAERTRHQIARHYPGLSPREAYRELGISTMNGNTGAGETITQADFRQIRRYVHRHRLARFTFWAVNRDRSCLARGHRPCSGVPQHDWQFTKIVTAVDAAGTKP